MAINTSIQKQHLILDVLSPQRGQKIVFEIAPEVTDQSLPINYAEGVVAGGESIQTFTNIGSESLSLNVLINDQGAKPRQNTEFKTVAEMIEIIQRLRKPTRASTPSIVRLTYAKDVNGQYHIGAIAIQVLQRNALAIPIRATITITLIKFKRSPI